MSLAATDALEAHRVRQSRQAREAYEALPGQTRNAIKRHRLEPIDEQAVRFSDGQETEPLDDHLHRIVSDPSIRDEIVTDPIKYQIQVDAVTQTLALVVPSITEGFDGGAGLGQALLAVLRREHYDDSVREIAKIHRCPMPTLRKMLVGIRHNFPGLLKN